MTGEQGENWYSLGMKYFRDGQNYLVVLKKGEELFDCLEQFVRETKTWAGWFDGLGAALEVELGFYDLDVQQYHWKTFPGPLEIAGLHGNIAQKDGQPAFHAHGSFAGADYRAFGGHIRKLIVAGTCELLIQPLNFKLIRQLEAETGLPLLSEA